MDSYCYRREREISNPSFSSTLLDAIYRSIDEAGDDDDEELVLYRETMRKKHSNMNGGSLRRDHQEHILNFQRACMIEKWMEKKVSETKVVLQRNSTAHFDTKSPNDAPHPMMLFNSTSTSSSSSDSSSGSGRGGGFSSSEAESVYYGTVVSSRSSSSCYGLQKKPKPIRTSVSVDEPRQEILINNKYHHDRRHAPQPKPKQKDEGGFSKSKSRALKKIYGDLKKVKQPISPGGRLASFLNSLFTAGGNTKKAKISSANDEDDEDDNIISSYSERKLFKSANASVSSTTCSSASSFSRSCLSKTPSSSRGKSGGTTTTTTTTKRSVRFYPVSVIVDEDCQPCGQKSLYDHEKKQSLRSTTTSIISSIHDDEELNKFHIMEKNRRVEEAARDLLLRNYQKKKKKVETDHAIDMTDSHIKSDQVFRHVDAADEELEEDDEDAASYASSDLFELDNLSAIGMERYREELPVYETTHLDTNRAIANGLIL